MTEFLTTALTFPTVVYSALLTVCAVYWLLAATGLLDAAAADGLLGMEADTPDGSAAAAMLSKLGLAGVPVMLVLTVLAFVGWFGAYFVQLLALGHVPGALRLAAGIALDILILIPGVLLTSLLLRPVGRWVLKLRPPAERSLLGRVGIVSSPQVTPDFGIASVDDGGAGLVLQVRHDDPGRFKRGDRIVLIEYIDAQHAYRVISEQQFQSL